MYFTVADAAPRAPLSLQGQYQAALLRDRWDDWGKYRTQFRLVVFDPLGQSIEIGDVKIAHAGLRPARVLGPGERAPALTSPFTQLEDGYFSLGQGEGYYEALLTLPEEVRETILTVLRDLAFDLELFAAYRDQDVMGESLLRFVSSANVTSKLHRLAHGDATPTPYSFDYRFHGPNGLFTGPLLEFRVAPGQQPPTNVHVLIGRNGAGKTRFLQSLANSITRPDEPSAVGQLQIQSATEDGGWAFASLVYVSFSAFDEYRLPPPSRSTMKAVQVSLAGETAFTDKSGKATKAGARLFSKSFETCRVGMRRRRWLDAIGVLENDPLFEETRVRDLANLPDLGWREEAEKFFGLLSSGHAVVLLTITRLVELVDERTLVLIDEPEGHLHPPLLSALIRSLSDLLTRRNGVAIIATHSPVVLQEVPRSCVWLLRRSGLTAVAERPRSETFGENVGSLTREVFGLEVTTAGFHTLVAQAVAEYGGDYQAVLWHFGEQLGLEARAIARGLSAVRAASDLPL